MIKDDSPNFVEVEYHGSDVEVKYDGPDYEDEPECFDLSL
jgi:hypothetical protein